MSSRLCGSLVDGILLEGAGNDAMIQQALNTGRLDFALDPHLQVALAVTALGVCPATGQAVQALYVLHHDY